MQVGGEGLLGKWRFYFGILLCISTPNLWFFGGYFLVFLLKGLEDLERRQQLLEKVLFYYKG